VLTTPQRFTRLNPRVDYQLNSNNTLMFVYEFKRSDIQDAGIGGFNLSSRGYHAQYTDQTVQVTETAVLGTSVNETRFQYYRSANEMIANSLSPEIHVSGSFNGGGSLSGGQGTVVGTIIGALIMGVLANGANLLGISSFTQQIVIGAVIVVAVTFDSFQRRRLETAGS